MTRTPSTVHGPHPTPDQVRDARLMLGWSQERLARLAQIPMSAVNSYERTGHLHAPMFGSLDRLAAIRAALEAAGADLASRPTGR